MPCTVRLFGKHQKPETPTDLLLIWSRDSKNMQEGQEYPPIQMKIWLFRTNQVSNNEFIFKSSELLTISLRSVLLCPQTQYYIGLLDFSQLLTSTLMLDYSQFIILLHSKFFYYEQMLILLQANRQLSYLLFQLVSKYLHLQIPQWLEFQAMVEVITLLKLLPSEKLPRCLNPSGTLRGNSPESSAVILDGFVVLLQIPPTNGSVLDQQIGVLK